MLEILKFNFIQKFLPEVTFCRTKLLLKYFSDQKHFVTFAK